MSIGVICGCECHGGSERPTCMHCTPALSGIRELPTPAPGHRRRAIKTERTQARGRSVVQELKECRRKLEHLRAEVKALRSAGSFAENARLRKDHDRLRMALSFIGHGPRAADMSTAELREVARIALEPRR